MADTPSPASPGDRDDRSRPAVVAELGPELLEQLYRQAIERGGLAHAIVDADGSVLEASAALGDLLGRASDELVGARLDELLPDLGTEGDEYEPTLPDLADLPRARSRVEQTDGSVTVVDLALVPLGPADSEPQLFAAWLREAVGDHHVTSLLGFSSSMAELRHSSTHDPLTDVYNRSTILDELGTMAESGAGAALLVDIDGFGALNDTLSHRHGDEVLRVVADRIALSLRDDATVGRTGADEFLLLVPGVETAEEAGSVAERLCRDIAELHVESLLPHLTTVCVGGALCRPEATPGDLLVEAQGALQHARRQGVGRWRVSDDLMRESALHDDLIDSQLQVAVESERIATWYQPLVDLITGECVGWEALARWILLDGTARSAGEFIENAERSGTIADLGHLVARDAVRRATRAPAGTVISINLTPTQLDAELVAVIEGLLARYGVGPAHLAIEMDSLGLLSLDGRGAELMDGILQRGLLLHVHNFTLDDDLVLATSRFPVTAAKLDRSVTSELRRGRAPRVLLDRVTDLAAELRTMGIRPVAEGVEDEVQAQTLRDAGWRYGQGYLFGPPAPATGGRMPRARPSLPID